MHHPGALTVAARRVPPLWALVDFAPGIPTDSAGRLEGALLAAGLFGCVGVT